MSRRPRLHPAIFNLPVDRMREGYYSDKYFVRAREVLQADGHSPRVLMQVFGKQHSYLGGIDEAIAILKLCGDDWPALTVHALYDGDEISPWETVLTIEGPYDAFAPLETLYLGVLARRTRVGTNTVSCPSFDRLLGSKMLFGNAELRFPLLGVLGIGSGYYGGFPIEMAFFGDAGIAWTNQDNAHKAWFLGGVRKPVYSAGVALRINLLGFAILEIDAAHPFNRTGSGIVWQFGLSPGF